MDIETKPENWILPNRIGYNKQTYKTFHPSKYHSDFEQSCDVNIKQLSLFPQQRIIRDYMQFDSPIEEYYYIMNWDLESLQHL